MSQKRKQQRQRHNAQEEEKGKKVVAWVFGGILALAIIFMLVMTLAMA